MAIKFSNTPARVIEPKTGKAKSGKKDAKSPRENTDADLFENEGGNK